MILFLKRVVIFFLIVFISQLGLYFAFNAIFSNYSDFRFNRYFRNDNFDIFILGNSIAVNSINERIGSVLSGKKVVNLAYNGMPNSNIIDFVDDINEKYTGKLIYIEISSLFKRSNSSNEYAFYMDKSKFIFSRFENTRYRYINLLRYNNEFFLRSLYYLNRSDQDWSSQNVINVSILKSIAKDKPFNLINEKHQFEERIQLIQSKCDAKGNKLIYFLGPYFPTYLSKALDYDYVKKVFLKRRLTFIDLNQYSMPNSYYSDRVHTNSNGAVFLTQKLLNSRIE
jgi:hypothetical protein